MLELKAVYGKVTIGKSVQPARGLLWGQMDSGKLTVQDPVLGDGKILVTGWDTKVSTPASDIDGNRCGCPTTSRGDLSVPARQGLRSVQFVSNLELRFSKVFFYNRKRVRVLPWPGGGGKGAPNWKSRT